LIDSIGVSADEARTKNRSSTTDFTDGHR